MFFSLQRFLFPADVPESIYDFQIRAIDGSVINFSDFRGKKILIVNTASFCGYTSQYQELEMLYREYKDKLVIVGFPANNFMFQEPGSNEKIAAFCKMKYDITFPMAAKISVKWPWKAPIYKWLTGKRYNGFADSTVKWNFQKYLVDESGKLTHIFTHQTPPLSDEIKAAIEQNTQS